jgi:hypothetical protein
MEVLSALSWLPSWLLKVRRNCYDVQYDVQYILKKMYSELAKVDPSISALCDVHVSI